ncbi:hypothetical protein vseg_018969 [Gypsophila vaccaria]
MASPPPPPPPQPPPQKTNPRLHSHLTAALTAVISSSSSWRPSSKLLLRCKSLLAAAAAEGGGVSAVTDEILSTFLLAAASNNAKVAAAAVSFFQHLLSDGLLPADSDSDRVVDSVCDCVDSHAGDEVIELVVIKAVLTAVSSVKVRVSGECLLRIVKTCYDVYLGSRSLVNQTTAKAALIQMILIVFRRMEADSVAVTVAPIVVADVMDPPEKDGADAGLILQVQGIISRVIHDIGGVSGGGGGGGGVSVHGGAFDTKVNATVEGTNPTDLLDSKDKDMLEAKYWEISMYKTALEGRKGELGEGKGNGEEVGAVVGGEKDEAVEIGNKFRRDGFMVFRALCKLSMKTPPKEGVSDPQMVRGKVVALELLKILLDNAGDVFRTNDRFLGAIKQYLCLSLLKNSASTLMIVYQLSCSIFMSLVARFRAGLKAEIGVFFPMIVLRVLENVAQPNFQQKMIVLRFLEKLCDDSQIMVDIFLNYDCDVNSSNIFERMVNGLLKTAQGVPPGVTTTLLPTQEPTLKFEAMKCLVFILKSMGDWINRQLYIPDPYSTKNIKSADDSSEDCNHHLANGTGYDPAVGSDSHSESSNDVYDVQTIEQRRAYKLELQEGISMFNRKPKHGIEFLINANKVGSSPEDIAKFLKDTSDLNKTVIGDYLGEIEEMSLKVMHAYVDSFDFQGMELDEAIRVFLQGFRLPGEAQKIDRILEKFAGRYWKCNPKAFSSADTAYVLAYSIIMLNTDAHNPTVKEKMSAQDFIKNNRGIDDGKDLPGEYMRSLYERITKNEIKLKDELASQQKQSSSTNRLLGLDSILNIVIRKQGEDSYMETNEDLIRHMQEQFKEKARKSESAYFAATDAVILRFMIEVCWAPMLAAFSVPLDQTEDEVVIELCLKGFRSAIHVTSVMSMKTHRDAFVTSLAKFTSLHSPADIKQKNIYAIKAILTIAEEDGNYLQEAWEHILTCVSRFEHLHRLGEGAPPDAIFVVIPQFDQETSKQTKSNIVLKKSPEKIPYAAAAVRRGSYDSATIGGTASITSKQINNIVSVLKILEQVGGDEMSRIFTHSQKLNSEAIIDFVKALCKVAMEELKCASNPRAFSLTKIVEIAHYNMNHVRLVWLSIWHVLTDFFVTLGCSENLSISILAVDSLRQLSMKFLEREELANYNFQNEFMKPFVIIMRKSSAVEIRELIIRCVSQMVLSRVNNVKSGWKSTFMVFTTAAYDEHKSIVLLAFEIMEKIVRDYFSYITETETTTFTDCVNCLIAFTNTRFNNDISLSAIGFLRYCAAKLSEGDLGSAHENKDEETSESVSPSSSATVGKLENGELAHKDDQLNCWFPLLAGLSELSFDPRPEIRDNAQQILFDTLRNYGHHFSYPLWEQVFESVLFRMFDYVRQAIDLTTKNSSGEGLETHVADFGEESWLYETCTSCIELTVDLFVKFYSTVHLLLEKVLTLLVGFVKRPQQSLAGIGIAALVRLISNAGDLFSDEKWAVVVLSLKDAAVSTLPDFSFICNEDTAAINNEYAATRLASIESFKADMRHHDSESIRTGQLHAALSDIKCRCAVQLLLIQAAMVIYSTYRAQIMAKNICILYDALRSVASHAHKINSDTNLCTKLRELGSITQMQDPPLLRLESESYQMCLTFLQNLLVDKPLDFNEEEVESYLIDLCREILQFYIEMSSGHSSQSSGGALQHWRIPLGSKSRRELAARGPLIVSTLQGICSLTNASFERNLVRFFPLLCTLIDCEHGSKDVRVALSKMLTVSAGPVLLRSC